MARLSDSIMRLKKLIPMVIGSSLLGNTDPLDPMEVSALRLETSPINLTARIQVIDQLDIDQSGAVDLV